MIIRVTDSSHAGEARRHAAILAEDAKLGERESGSLAIAVTEMVTNVVKHAGNGTVIVEAVTNNGSSGVRVLGLDRGPGIRDLGASLRDGFSTAELPATAWAQSNGCAIYLIFTPLQDMEPRSWRSSGRRRKKLPPPKPARSRSRIGAG